MWCIVRDDCGKIVLRVQQHPTGLFVLNDDTKPCDDIDDTALHALLTRSYILGAARAGPLPPAVRSPQLNFSSVL